MYFMIHLEFFSRILLCLNAITIVTQNNQDSVNIVYCLLVKLQSEIRLTNFTNLVRDNLIIKVLQSSNNFVYSNRTSVRPFVQYVYVDRNKDQRSLSRVNSML